MLGFTKEQEVEYQEQNTERWLDIDFLVIRIRVVFVYMQKIGSRWH
jgi:hypothetical protein